MLNSLLKWAYMSSAALFALAFKVRTSSQSPHSHLEIASYSRTRIMIRSMFGFLREDLAYPLKKPLVPLHPTIHGLERLPDFLQC